MAPQDRERLDRSFTSTAVRVPGIVIWYFQSRNSICCLIKLGRKRHDFLWAKSTIFEPPFLEQPATLYPAPLRCPKHFQKIVCLSSCNVDSIVSQFDCTSDKRCADLPNMFLYEIQNGQVQTRSFKVSNILYALAVDATSITTILT